MSTPGWSPIDAVSLAFLAAFLVAPFVVGRRGADPRRWSAPLGAFAAMAALGLLLVPSPAP
jgi:hypothetical protein